MNKLNVILKASSIYLLAFSFSTYAQEFNSLKNVNSSFDEQNPYLSPQGELFFSRGFHPSNKGGETDLGDIWIANLDSENHWSKPQQALTLSTSANDVVIGFADPITLLVYHGGDSEKPQGIHQYRRFGSSWTYLRPLEIENFMNKSSLFSGKINSSGDLMLLSFEGNPTYGNEDIYILNKLSEEKWSFPKNLGPIINTHGQELSPIFSENEEGIFFSTNAIIKNQGLNIFFSKMIGNSWDHWSSPQALNELNSNASETSYLQIDSKTHLLCSTQNSEGFGDFIIFNFELPNTIYENNANTIETPLVTTTTIAQRENSDFSNSTEDKFDIPIFDEHIDLKVLNSENNHEINFEIFFIGDTADELSSLSVRSFSKKEWESKDWDNLMIKSPGFIPQYFSKVQWMNRQRYVFTLDPIKSGKKLILENIQFQKGTTDVLNLQNLEVLHELVIYLKNNPLEQIKIEGHTDNIGDPTLNKELSHQRAQTIRKIIMEHGISFQRIKIAGWGGTLPISSNDSEEGRKKNRRVEIQIEK